MKLSFQSCFTANNDPEASEFVINPAFQIETVREAETIQTSKEYTVGKNSCHFPYDYLVVLTNPSQLFPSTTVLHMVDLVSEVEMNSGIILKTSLEIRLSCLHYIPKYLYFWHCPDCLVLTVWTFLKITGKISLASQLELLISENN